MQFTWKCANLLISVISMELDYGPEIDDTSHNHINF